MTIWQTVYCPACLHEDQADLEMLERGLQLHCEYCGALMAEYQDLPNRVRVKVTGP